LATYAHALPGMHKDAAARVGAVLHRSDPASNRVFRSPGR
jgi:hypothetical protein